jgi:hypothetical protein
MSMISIALEAFLYARKPKIKPKQKRPMMLRINAVFASLAASFAFDSSTCGG